MLSVAVEHQGRSPGGAVVQPVYLGRMAVERVKVQVEILWSSGRIDIAGLQGL